jgi:hypothetical protein
MIFRMKWGYAPTIKMSAVLYVILIIGCESKKITGSDTPLGYPPNTPSITQIFQTLGQTNGIPSRGLIIMISDTSNDEDGFRLERRSPGGAFASIATLSQNTDEYTDWGLGVSIQYTYRVQAFNEFGDSSWSNERTETSAELQSEHIIVYSDADATVYEEYPDANFGGQLYFEIAGQAGYWGERAYSLIYFPLPDIPTFAFGLEGAHLVTCEAGGGNSTYPGAMLLNVRPVTGQWYENSVTWNNYPAPWLGNPGTAIHNPNTIPCVSIDVYDIVSDWYVGFPLNWGFLIESESAAYCRYYARETNSEAYLIITYSY